MKKIIVATSFVIGLGLLAKLGFAADVKAAGDPSGKIYQAKCASCHGKDGKGNASMAKIFKVDASVLDLTSQAVIAKKDEELNAVTTNGKGKMPAYKGKLTEAEIAGTTAYIRSLAPAPVPAGNGSAAPVPAPATTPAAAPK